MRLSAAGLVFVVLMGSLSGCLSADSNAKSGMGPSFTDPCESGESDTTWYHFANATPAESDHVIAHLYGWDLLWNRYDNI